MYEMTEGTIQINRQVVLILAFVTVVIACGVIGILSVIKKSNGAFVLDIWSQQHDQHYNGLYFMQSDIGWTIYEIQGSGKVRVIYIVSGSTSSQTTRAIENVNVEWQSSRTGVMKLNGVSHELKLSIVYQNSVDLKQLELKSGDVTVYLYALITTQL